MTDLAKTLRGEIIRATATLLLGVIAVGVWANVLMRPNEVSTEMALLNLSQSCAQAAEGHWQRYRESLKEFNEEKNLQGYQSHYNRELHRCLIYTVRSRVSESKDSITFFDLMRVSDAVEGRDLAQLTKQQVGDKVVQSLTSGNKRLDPTPENFAWFNGLMEK